MTTAGGTIVRPEVSLGSNVPCACPLGHGAAAAHEDLPTGSSTGPKVGLLGIRIIGDADGACSQPSVATFSDPAVTSRIETAMEWAHGMVMPIESVDAAKTA